MNKLIPAFACFCLAASVARSQTVVDNFAGPSLNAAWTFIDDDNAPGGSATIKNGALELSGRGGDIYGVKNQFVAVYRSDFVGDFDVSVEILSQDSTHSYAQAGILVANDIKDLSKGGFAAFDISPGHGFNLFYDKTAPMGTLDAHQGAGKTAYPAWLRLVKRGVQFTAFYKLQAGAAWTQVLPSPTLTQGTQSASQIALFSLSHDSTKTCRTVFDDFSSGMQATSIAPRLPVTSVLPEAPVLFVDAAGRLRSQGAGRKARQAIFFLPPR